MYQQIKKAACKSEQWFSSYERTYRQTGKETLLFIICRDRDENLSNFLFERNYLLSERNKDISVIYE